jgi:hypothetical protein
MENLRFVNTSFESTFVNTTQSIDCGTLSQSLYYTHTLSHSINIVLNAVHQRARVRSSIHVCEWCSWRQSCCDQTLRYICNHTPHDRCATHVGQPLRPPAAAQCPDVPLAQPAETDQHLTAPHCCCDHKGRCAWGDTRVSPHSDGASKTNRTNG